MCGIAGCVDPHVPAPAMRHIVQRMTDVLVHRGPDDEGFFVAPSIGLGMRRLSIIDVAGGHQPIANADGQVQVICNGEIYNYLELRATLESRGHHFRTDSDTEVIVHLYEDQGIACLQELRGMFGFALWDQRARRLLLARDRLGKKPLFYALQSGRFLFGSEIKALLAAAPCLAKADPEAIVPYFRHGFVPEPGTMFQSIRKLPAAHYAVYEDGDLRVEPYWHLPICEDDETQRDPREWVEELDALLEEAVRIRLRSDVPLGIFLSGGLDSSAIAAYAHKTGLHPINTFTIGFDRPEWDESADAQRVATHLHTDHHVLTLREHDLVDTLPDTVLSLVRHFDEPFGDDSALPTYHVSKLAREHVTVILSGDGGDELFAGYSSYRGVKFAAHYRRLPLWLGRHLLPTVFHEAARYLPVGPRYRALRVAKVLRDSSLPFNDLYFSKAALCRDATLQQLFTPDLQALLNQDAMSMHPADIISVMGSNLPELSKAAYTDIRSYLLDDLLVKVDRMSMAHGLEVRSPLLDQRLVEFAVRLPPTAKLRGWETKAIFRDTIRPYLPPTTIRKRKQGFGAPIREWLRNGLAEIVGDYLNPAHGHLPQELFHAATVQRILEQHQRGDVDHSKLIWLLLNYATWHDLYIR